MNEADSEYIAQRAASAGYAIARRPEEADVLIVNTCTVRDNAERRAYGRINQLKRLKEARAAVKLVVTGCLAEQERDRMRERAPHVDAVFGTSELGELGDAIARWRSECVDDESAEQRALIAPFGGSADCVSDAFSHLRGFVTVQRGCSYYCTFCIVPHVRGRFDHRPKSEILREVRQRVESGAREVMLVGQTVNAYRDPVSGDDFADLCIAVAATPGVERLAFISPHPKDFSLEIIPRLTSIRAMASRVHLPLQSASDAVLRRMNRKYTLAQYERTRQLFAQHAPHWAITTDIIVGFPGETEDDFTATLEYVERAGFANAYMFVYSPRRGTPAARWDQVPQAVAADRFARLLETQNARSREFHTRQTGSVVRALVQGPSKKDPSKVAAKTSQNVTVIAPLPPGLFMEEFSDTPWIDVEIDRGFVWGCSGVILSRARAIDERGNPVARPIYDLLAV